MPEFLKRPRRAAVAALSLLLAAGAAGCAAQAQPPAAASPSAVQSTLVAPRAVASADASNAAADAILTTAKKRWALEQSGPAVQDLLRRVAADPALKTAVRSGSVAAITAAVDAKFRSVWYHWHVSRLRVVQNGKVVVDVGVPFVVAPSSVRMSGPKGTTTTLEISDQDVIGFVRFMRRNHGVDVVARGTLPGHVRTSLPAALRVTLPDRGPVTIAGTRYQVRTFTKHALDNEVVKVWILVRS